MSETYVSPLKAAMMLGVTTQTIRNWSNSNKIKIIRTKGNHRRIAMSEINKIIESEGVRNED